MFSFQSDCFLIMFLNMPSTYIPMVGTFISLLTIAHYPTSCYSPTPPVSLVRGHLPHEASLNILHKIKTISHYFISTLICHFYFPLQHLSSSNTLISTFMYMKFNDPRHWFCLYLLLLPPHLEQFLVSSRLLKNICCHLSVAILG